MMSHMPLALGRRTGRFNINVLCSCLQSCKLRADDLEGPLFLGGICAGVELSSKVVVLFPFYVEFVELV